MDKWLNEGWIYQIFCGRWEGLDTRKPFLANLADLDWGKIKNLGAKTIYFLGLWDSRGPIIVKEEEGVILDNENRLPSMMAIRDHTRPHPDLGNEEELRMVINRIHKDGLRVIADFVPNHTATSHPWIEEHPEYYQKNDQGNMIYEFSGDVVKLNYENQNLRQEMIAIGEMIAEYGFDGVRCDMAHLIPNVFWSEIITRIKKIKTDFVFIGECYDDNPFGQVVIDGILESGFSAVYDHVFYKNLERIIVQKFEAEEMAQHLNHMNSGNKINRLVRYASNHDDPPLGNRREDTERAELINKYRNGLITLVTINGEIGMFANGFLCGTTGRLAHHSHEMLPADKNEMLGELNEEIKKILTSEALRHHGDFTWQTDEGLLIGYSGDGLRVAINFTDHDCLLKLNAVHSSPDEHLNMPGQILPVGGLKIWRIF